MTVQEYTERGLRLWAFRCWGTDTCDGWLGLRHQTQASALRERERHVAEAHAEVVAQPGYCPHCGRGDCAPTADAYEQQRQRAERAETAIIRLLNWADELDKTTRGISPEATHPVAGHIRHRIDYDPRKEN